ncbi:efflux RND transporter periplasmic adaptor subunit [Thiolinea disciformis]|uniref:efflux RND transporter periplasmic adaptor subunit n=1 Tax=Thiolinea disciformis TaxID=125614 RepID=UPI000374E85B|nr:efflux RND transporter periplasmic adaptor subunit [Thiolinea disciformis]
MKLLLRYWGIYTLSLIFATSSAVLQAEDPPKDKSPAPATGSAPKGPPPAQVTVLTVQASDVKVSFEYVGQVAGARELEVRSRITGIVQKRLFEEGSPVEKDQALYEIEAANYKAALDQAIANLKQAEAGVVSAEANRTSAIATKASAEASLANAQAGLLSAKAGIGTASAGEDSARSSIASAAAQLKQAQSEYNRVAPLVAKQLLSRSQLDSAEAALSVAKANYDAQQAQAKRADSGTAQAQAVTQQAQSALLQAQAQMQQAEAGIVKADAAIEQAKAAVVQAQAGVNSAKINVDYTIVRSPASGVVGRAQKVEGSLVEVGSNSLMTTVAQIDPVYVNFGIPEKEHLMMREDLSAGALKMPEGGFMVSLSNSEGKPINQNGKISFQDYKVDTSTGNVATRATISNADKTLSPGQFVRVRLLGASRPNSISVPQRAVLDNPRGKFVYVVGQDDKGATVAQPRPVEVGQWAEGMKPEEKMWVIRSGLKAGDQLIVDGVARILMPNQAIVVSTDTATTEKKPN